MTTLDRLAALADKSGHDSALFKLFSCASNYLSILAIEMALQSGTFRMTNEPDGVALRTHGVIVKVVRVKHLCKLLVSGTLDGRKTVDTLSTDAFSDMEKLARFVRLRMASELKRAA